MTDNLPRPRPLALWLGFGVRMILFAVALLWPAGTWRWWEAWVLVGLWTAFGVVMTHRLMRHDPALLAERMRPLPMGRDQKRWDMAILVLFLIGGIGLYVVPGFDVVRHAWSEPLPLWVRLAAMLVHLPCFLALGWIMHENTFLSPVVKIDRQRGQRVITTGPYAWVRHPMYSVVMVLLFAVPMALGSRFALLVALALTALLILRTWLEDLTLHAELEGYVDYARQTPYRLMPGVW